jgi:hypothetical protein
MNSEIKGIYFYKNDQIMKQIIDTMRMMCPDLYKDIMFKDLTHIPYKDYPNIVKANGQLPIMIYRGIREPIIGVVTIQKWIASQVQMISMNNNNNKNVDQNQNQMMYASNDLLSGHGGFHSLSRSTGYEYLDGSVSESIYGSISDGNQQMTQTQSQNNDQKYEKGSKNQDVNARYQQFMNERKSLDSVQNGGGIPVIRN